MNYSVFTKIVQSGNPSIVQATVVKSGQYYEQFGAASGVMDATDIAIARVKALANIGEDNE